MDLAQNPESPGWIELWRARAQTHPRASAGFLLALVTLVWLLAASLLHVATGKADAALRLGILGGLAGFAATALGALPALFLRNLAERTEDTLLGFAAGMMLAASSFSLILPGLAAGASITGSAVLGAWAVVAGLGLGVLLMLGLDEFTPHAHEHGGAHGAGCARVGRVWLFVFAIALHNLPEGMAVAMALKAAGLAPGRAVAIAAASGLMEPVGALLGVGLASGLALAYPVGMGLAAGAMIFVVSHEVIPETHRNGHQTPATLGLMAGFAVMMVLDTTLG